MGRKSSSPGRVRRSARTAAVAGGRAITCCARSRFDVNHPETNGMIDYFVGPMNGVSTRITAADAADFAAQQGMSYRAEPAGIVTGPLGAGTLNLAAAARLLREIASTRIKFT